MASTKWTEHYFRKALKDKREALGLTQPELAEVFRASGLDLHWSTIAKIESGDRSVRIDEAARIADVFETSVDVMLGRATGADAAVDAVTRELQRFVYAANTVLDDVRSARIDLAKSALNMRAAANWQPPSGAGDLVEASVEVCELLGQADRVLTEALPAAETDLAKALDAAESGLNE